jgi:gluconokinase
VLHIPRLRHRLPEEAAGSRTTEPRREHRHGSPCHVVVMGVSGTGKTTVGERVAAALGARFIEGDAHHPPANIAKMAAGTPLTDEDRAPWLEALGELLAEHDRRGGGAVLACSALRRCYRDVLRRAVPGSRVFFVHLDGPREVLERRMGSRTKHFMPAALLRSQRDTLEPLGPDEPGAVVDVSAPLDDVVDAAAAAVVRGCSGSEPAS